MSSVKLERRYHPLPKGKDNNQVNKFLEFFWISIHLIHSDHILEIASRKVLKSGREGEKHKERWVLPSASQNRDGEGEIRNVLMKMLSVLHRHFEEWGLFHVI